MNHKFPSSWISAELGEICEIFDSRRKPINASERSKRNEGKSDSELFPYYGATGEAGKINSYLFDGPHVLIGEDAAPFLEPHRGVAYLVTGKFWVNNHAHILKHPTSNRFLCYYLLQVNYRPFVTGTTRLKLNQEQLRKIPLPLPPLAEQKRIVSKIEELFSELDAGEESLRRARRQLGVYRQSLLKQAFEGKLTAPWRKQNPHLLESPDQLLNRIQAERQARYAEELRAWEAAGRNGSKPKKPIPIQSFGSADLVGNPVVPDVWIVMTYGDLCSVVRNGISQKPSGTSGHKIARISAVRPMAFDLQDYRFLDCGDDFASEFTLRADDLVFTRYNGARRFVGVCARFPSSEPRLYPDKLIRTCPDLPSLDSRFLEIALNTGLSRAWLETKIRTTAGQSGVSGGDVKAMPVPLCCLPEQREIVRLLDEQFTVIEQNEREIDAALKRSAALRQSILKKAFTGQLVPQDPTDEPASVLLERIREERDAAAKAQKKKARA